MTNEQIEALRDKHGPEVQRLIEERARLLAALLGVLDGHDNYYWSIHDDPSRDAVAFAEEAAP